MKKTSSKLRYSLILLALVIVGFIVKALFFSSVEQPNYITATAKKGDIELTVLSDGSIEAAKMVNVGAQVSGQIKALHVALGDRITKGQAIAEIDDLTQQNNLKEAQATLKNLEAQKASKNATLINNQIAFNRQKTLLAKGVAAKADYDSAKATLDANIADIEALDAQITKAQISVDTASLNLGYTKISSPMDGVVVAIPVEEGQTVNAVQSAPTIIKVAQLDTMTIKAQISEADVTKVAPNMPVYFTILGEPNKRYTATLRSVEPAPNSINSDTSSSSSSSTATAIFYNGLFDVPNTEDKLRISMTAQVYIVLEQAKDAIIIPSTALTNINYATKEATVQVIESQGAAPVARKVKFGINNNINAQIISGLQENEQVIISDSGNGSGTGMAQRRMSIRM
jgi:macrolide-specific efflux system membrane fusion protein